MGAEVKVMIGIPTAEFARQAVFYDYFSQLQKPVGTMQTSTHGQSPARGRNLIIEQALEFGCSHILFIDDDTLVPPNLLTKLLEHDKDIVTALYLMRNHPHRPIIFSYANERGECLNHYPYDGETGLIEIINCGLGAVLIKTEVFKKMKADDKNEYHLGLKPYPWVRLGELEPDHWCDDIGFFNRCREAGYKLYCDLDLAVGHMATVAVWPGRTDGVWRVDYDTFGEGRVSFPSIKPKKEDYDAFVGKLDLVGAK